MFHLEKRKQVIDVKKPTLIFIFLHIDLFAKERNRNMGIVLIAVGKIDKGVMETLKDNLSSENKEYITHERVLGIVDHDLYVSELNFVFGEAGRNVAVILLTRLRQGFYGLSEDNGLFHKRVLTEAVHGLGRTYGLAH